ncbi:antibiotic biosynthesis monooxygenase family protein [Roseibium salinum]|uniref:Antibiotic biosynthesis monooxygenase n=1 Tax=Roseibium salinum TaxID=1604349 RepID=A0ABT3R6H1_9HYPH|nr:antibiotic biosynthesis monooxygenase [Roseibium sp. DSM 29163]MCX2724726.1 antibiotic biosynthesis monooxygenase [Roseibium sp. DSM 29163]
MSSVVHSQSVFRVDKFTVPLEAREAFLERLKTIRALLEGIDGCRQNLVLEQGSDSGAAKFATIVEWRDQRALETAREKVAAEYRKADFNPQDFMRQLGVTADMGNYSVV